MISVKNSSAKESAKKSEEEIRLIEKLKGCKRKWNKENMEEETKIVKDLFKIREQKREAAREEQLKRKKKRRWKTKEIQTQRKSSPSISRSESHGRIIWTSR